MEDEGLELGEGEMRLDSPVLVLDCVKTKEFRVGTTPLTSPQGQRALWLTCVLSCGV